MYLGKKLSVKKRASFLICLLINHLQIAKNVASDVAGKLCESVAAKLEGRVMGTFQV